MKDSSMPTWPRNKRVRALVLSDVRQQSFEAILGLCEELQPDILLYAGDDVSRFGVVSAESRVSLARRAAAKLEVGRVPVSMESGLTAWVGVRPTQGGLLFDLGIDNQIRISNSGDATVVREPRVVGNFASLARSIPLGIAGVIGNDCAHTDAEVYSFAGGLNLHESSLVLGDWTIIGLAGAPDVDGIGYSLYSEEAAARHLDDRLSEVRTPNCLLVSHAPPKGVLDTAVRYGRRSIGSQAVRARLTRLRVVVCGHVHRYGGRIETVDDCLVVNAANHDDEYSAAQLNYCLLELDTGGATPTIGTYYDPNSVESLHGVGFARAKALRSHGFLTIADVAEASQAQLSVALGSDVVARKISIRAQVFSCKEPHVLDVVQAPYDYVVVDVETSVDRQDDPWLIGLGFPDGRVVQLEELDHGRHIQQLRRLDALLDQWAWDHTLIQWSGFDRAALARAYQRVGLDSPDWLGPENWFNACSWAQVSVALPGCGYGLKDLERFLKIERRHTAIDGFEVGSWYTQYRLHGSNFDVGLVREYNQDDVTSCRRVFEALRQFVRGEALR